MVNGSFDIGFKIEDILVELMQDGNGTRLKGLKEACITASENLNDWTPDRNVEAYQLRETCFLPFKIALESRSAKLATLAVSGLQKLLSDERFQSVGSHEKLEYQFPVQFLNAITATPSLSDEVQVEVMKLLLLITCSESCEVHGEQLVKTAEVCIETYVRAHQGQTKTACRATLTQMLSSVCHRLQESMLQKSMGKESFPSDGGVIATDASKVLSHDVVLILAHFSRKLQQTNDSSHLNHAVPLYLEGIQVMLFNLSTAMQQDREFVNLIRKTLTPALIKLLGAPSSDSHNIKSNISDSNISQDGTNRSHEKTPSPLIAKSIYTIVGELVRIIGCLQSLRPTMESLFERMLSLSPPQHRIEALKILKEILGSPQRIFDLAGPTMIDNENGEILPPKIQNKKDLDLFKLVIDGIQESCHQSEPSVCSAAVACIVSLLGTLEDLSYGRGLSDEHIEYLSKIKDPANWEDVLFRNDLKNIGENSEGVSSPIHSQLELSESESENEENERKEKPKHIRWQMDYEEAEGSALESGNESENSTVITPKTVTWASDHEERIIYTNDEKTKARGGTEEDLHEEDKGTKSPKPILRRSSSFSTADKKEDPSKAKEDSSEKQGKAIPRLKKLRQQQEEPRSPSKETTINGIPLSKLPRQKVKASHTRQKNKPQQKVVTASEPQQEEPVIEKTLEEIEKEGARNFARCLLGILPSVLSATEPSVADEALQQFASDVCEAVSCMTLKRKNVPNFGTKRQLDPLEESTNDNDPLLNADGVYKTVYETLKLNFSLHCLGFYSKKRGVTIPLSQDEFIDSITKSGIEVRLSRVWLSEVYRLVTTYDILSKAGYVRNSNETHRALIGILSDDIYNQHPFRTTYNDLSPSKRDLYEQSPSKKEGVKFARRLLLCTWSEVLDVLATPLDTKNFVGGNGSFGIALLLKGEDNSKSKKLSLERDLVCLSLDGFRRAARLCCTLEIHAHCDKILSRLAAASCSEEVRNFDNATVPGIIGPMKLHAAHVLSMDALLAAGLELGRHAPQAWIHVFRCCMYISHLEHASFKQPNESPQRKMSNGSVSIGIEGQQHISVDTSLDNSRSDNTQNGILNSEDACRAVYALSSTVDHLFDMAATTLPVKAFREFLTALIEASKEQLFGKDNRYLTLDGSMQHQNNAVIQQQMITMNNLHLYHICDVMLRCSRNNNRPLLHVIEAWLIISSHLVEAAYHKARHISKVALTSIHDILSEILKRRSELSHFNFFDDLFKPFNLLMGVNTLKGVNLCDDEIQDQILYTMFELVEGFGPSIKSGWRSIFGALGNTGVYSRHVIDEINDGEQRRKLVFNIIDNFVNLKSNSVFASSVVSAILCLIKFLRGKRASGEEDPSDSPKSEKNDEEDEQSDTESNLSDSLHEHSFCQPILDALNKISKRLSNIYIQPSSSIFYGSYSILLVNMKESQDKVWDDAWSVQSSSTISSFSPENERKENISSTAYSIVAIDDTGILRVWFLILEGLTTNVTTSPKKFQPMIIELLFEVLRSVTTVPGPHFSMFVLSNLVLPMLQRWVQRGSHKRSYWDSTLPNFKHACGQATQLVVEEIGHFLSVEGASDCAPLMLKQLVDLYQECILQPVETIARLGCSCLRHLLLAAGPQFSEELWHIVCTGIQQIIGSTLKQLLQLIDCFDEGSNNVTGDGSMNVKVVARRDTSPTQSSRLMQLAKQVFLLESQSEGMSPKREEFANEEVSRSFIFIISSLDEPSDSNKSRIPFRALTISLLSNQILTQMLGSMLLESADSIKGSIISTITDSGLMKRNNEDSSLPGLLCYLSPVNLGILFDCLMESYNVAHEFNMRPGLRALIQKLAGFPVPSNLLRQSITSFAFYLNTLFQISKHDGENFTISNIKRILTGEKVSLDSTEESPTTDNHSPDKNLNGNKYKNLLKGDVCIDWIIRRLYEACNQISAFYQVLNQSEGVFTEQDSGFLENISINTSCSQVSPMKLGDSMSDENIETGNTNKTTSSKFSPFRFKKNSQDYQVESNSKIQTLQNQRRREDQLLHLSAWSQLITSMLELLLGLPTLQFKSVLPAVFPAVTSLINIAHDQKVRQLVCDVVRRCGSIYGII